MEALITSAAMYHSGKKCRRINCLSQAETGRGQYLCQTHSDERTEKIFRSFGNLPRYTTNT